MQNLACAALLGLRLYECLVKGSKLGSPCQRRRGLISRYLRRGNQMESACRLLSGGPSRRTAQQDHAWFHRRLAYIGGRAACRKSADCPSSPDGGPVEEPCAQEFCDPDGNWG